MKVTRTCACCGNEYSYCLKDAKHSDDMWRNAFDTTMCRDVFKILSAYSAEIATAEEVIAVVNSFGVTDYSIFKASIATKLNNIAAQITEDVAE